MQQVTNIVTHVMTQVLTRVLTHVMTYMVTHVVNVMMVFDPCVECVDPCGDQCGACDDGVWPMKAACHAVPDPALVFRIQSSKAPDKDCDGPFCPLTIPLVDMPVTKGPPIDFLTPFLIRSLSQS